MGHSMGGKVASMIAQLAPQYIEGLIILEAPLIGYIKDYDQLIPPQRRLNAKSYMMKAAKVDPTKCKDKA